jgi:hypothetical protein
MSVNIRIRVLQLYLPVFKPCRERRFSAKGRREARQLAAGFLRVQASLRTPKQTGAPFHFKIRGIRL